MKKVICFISMVMIVSGVALAEGKTYANRYYGISITGAEEWKTFIPARPEEHEGIKVHFSKYGFGAIPLKSGYSLPEVIIDVTPNWFKTNNVLDYAKYDIDRYPKSGFTENFELIENPKTVNINGNEGVMYSFSSGDPAAKQKTIQYIFITDKGVIRLTASAGFNDFENNLPIFNQIINSFKLK